MNGGWPIKNSKANQGNSVVFFTILTFIIHYTSTSISTYVKFHALSTEYKVETQTIKSYSLEVKQTMGARAG